MVAWALRRAGARSAGRFLIIRVGFALGALVGLLAVGEVALRLLQHPFAPDGSHAFDPALAERAGGLHGSRLSFDSALFWRRAAAPSIARDPGEFLLLVLGDEGALGRGDTALGWPEALAYVVSLNETSRPVRVVNAAEPGYSSFQGARRFAQLASLRPDAVCFAFGRNDARRARAPDARYARQLERMGPLSRSWLAMHAAHAAWSWLAPAAGGARVPVNEFRSNAGAFTERAQAVGATPVLVAGGPADYALALHDAGARAGARVLTDSDPVRLAESLLDVLAGEGIVLSRRRRAAEIDFVDPRAARPELSGAWRPAEAWEDGARGRRPGREASVALEPLSEERGVALDVTCPEGFGGRVEVDGGASHDMSDCRGREWRRFGLGVKGERIEMRFVAGGASNAGLLVHSVRLVPSGARARIASARPHAAELNLAEAPDERPELGPGLWPHETWSDGRRGRWTAREASFWLARQAAERALLLDVSLQRPDNLTVCRIEANGIPVYEFRTRNGRHRFGIDIQRVPGRVVHVRLLVGRTFVPGHGDDRALGLFVHSVRLASSEVP